MAVSTAAPAEAKAESGLGTTLRAFAVRFRQKRPDVNLFVTALPLKRLLGRFEADTYRRDNRRGYQRPVSPTRLRQISAYMRDEEGMLPTSIVLCVRKPYHAAFEPAVGANGAAETGLLQIGPDIPLWVVDGQHRLYGLQRALAHDKAEWLAEYPLPVVIVEGIDAYEEMRYFHVINTRHKGVPTDVVDRHLLSMREEEGQALLERQGERDYQRARATMLTDLLNTSPESPWRGMIRMPGESLRAEMTMKQHSMVSSLEPVVNDSLVKRLSDDEAGKLVLNYWNAAKERWQSAFEEPNEYVIQKALGAGALHQIFPDVIELCRAADDFSQTKIFDVLSDAGRSAGFWHLTRGHYMVRHNGARYVRALAQYLRERLPRPILRRL
ncbi:MAG TPA: DGQHR domain-containing protein [Dehalococcoidia bacterium]|jgi:DGQHR domain-containing protein|nr:DGQHR domain-containing protein [Dehalococcoidia bacterium]